MAESNLESMISDILSAPPGTGAAASLPAAPFFISRGSGESVAD